ncbi:hypothetical protein ACLK1T_17820 [Escherichia coli]
MIDTVGHLCDCILFDSAWVGYEQFIPMMADSSPLLLELNGTIRDLCDPVVRNSRRESHDVANP